MRTILGFTIFTKSEYKIHKDIMDNHGKRIFNLEQKSAGLEVQARINAALIEQQIRKQIGAINKLILKVNSLEDRLTITIKSN